MQVACGISLEIFLDEGYNFASKLIVIGGLHAKLCALKVVGVLVVGILGLPRQKAIWMWLPWRGA
jgi:hypothetical protein